MASLIDDGSGRGERNSLGPEVTGATVAAWLSRASKMLQEGGIDSARIDARLLLQELSGLSAGDVIAHPGQELSPQTLKRLDAAIARRLVHEPVSRILGWREFYGRRFKITGATLDPRPDSETLIDAVLQLAKRKGWHDRPVRIIDVGTGSGCLLLTLLAELPLATGVGTDICNDALAIARHNAAALQVSARAGFLQGDSLKQVNEVFQLLVSNPPYIPGRDIAALAPEVRQFDPHGALDGGEDGLDIYRAITSDISRVVPVGYAVFEVAAGQAMKVTGMFSAASPGWLPEKGLNLHDLGGHQRAVVMRSMIGGN